MAKVLMIQGTMSNVGKSVLTAGLCRVFHQDGYRVAPFKSQNMALNSYSTAEGLEMGRAQVMQAEAAGIEPQVCMNPILLKPTSHTGSQVIVNGKVSRTMGAREYFACKKALLPQVQKAFCQVCRQADIVVVEGAGSPAEINLRDNDIVNMGLAERIDAPVLLVGDIDRGGVFAQLLGTLLLLTPAERERVKGLVINQFRGDRSLLDPGIIELQQRGKKPVLGVVPYLDLSLEDEDSLSGRFGKKQRGSLDLAVIRYPRISNFTDFNVFEQREDVSVRYVSSVRELGRPDILFLPGSKNTMGDLLWMRQNGLEKAVKALSRTTPIFGICGGYQMLGDTLCDPLGIEEGITLCGMGLLPVTTTLGKTKDCHQCKGRFPTLRGPLSSLSGTPYDGYVLHMGQTVQTATGEPAPFVMTGENPNVYGTYLHGAFDSGETAGAILRSLAEAKGLPEGETPLMDYRALKEEQYNKLADGVRQAMNMEAVYGILREARLNW
ncbi:MAG: cobyric acid synthase [Oscillospiraceae bacterium]|nr:cobyric acid synthase [Oscillospiraceae bacterium]